MDFGESDIFRLSSESEGEAEGVGEGENVVSLVHQAASRGDTRQLVQVVQRDPSLLEQPNADGMTPLGQAVMSQQMPAVKRLVKMGADINAQDGMGRTSLSIAAYQGWLEGVVYLLRNGARQNIPDKTGRLPLHASTYHSDPRTLVTLLQSSSPTDVNQTDHEQMTAVHWAAFHKRPEHVRCLIERGASLLAPDMDGKLPLHWAAQNGCRETCHLLLHASILRQGQGEIPGEGEEKRGEIPGEGERSHMLTAQDHSGKTALHFAAAAGHPEVIRQLAFYPACHPDSPDPDDRTPLHWAAAMGHAQCVQVLLDLGVKANVKDVDGGTALSYAQQSAHNECIHLLEQALNITAGDSSSKKMLDGEGGGGGKKGKNPLEFLKGLFLSPRKDNSGPHTSAAPSRLKPPPPPPLLASSTHPVLSSPQNSLSSSPLRPPNSQQGGSDRVSLPSIHATRPPLLSEGNAGADVSRSTSSSFQSDVMEAEQVEERKPVKGEKEVKYRATHIPALPPLLPDLSNPVLLKRDSGCRVPAGSEGRWSPQDLGPLRGGPPPQTRQLNTRAADRLHDGMLFQRSVTDFRPAECQDPSPRPPTTSAIPQAMKGSRKRGPPPPSSSQQNHHHPSLTQQPSGTPRDAAEPASGREVGMRRAESERVRGHCLSALYQGVVSPSAVLDPRCGTGVSVLRGSSVPLSHGSKVTLPNCRSSVPVLLQNSASSAPAQTSHESDPQQQPSRAITLPQCPSVPLTCGGVAGVSLTAPGCRSGLVRSNSTVRVPQGSSAGPQYGPPSCSNHGSELVIDSISNTSSLPNAPSSHSSTISVPAGKE